MTIKKALFVGGGIAGTSAAISLARLGIACDVAEMSDEPTGATITMLSRSINGLKDLGVLESVLAQGTLTTPETHWRYLDHTGTEIPTPPMPPRVESELPWGIYIMRSNLIDELRKAAIRAGARLRIGTRATEFEERGEIVNVRFSDGSEDSYDLIVGADGVRSNVRRQIFPQSPSPAYSGVTMFRGMFDGISEELPIGAYIAGDTFVMTHRVPDGRTYMATGQQYAAAPRISQAEAREIVRALLAPFSAPLIRGIVSQIDDNYRVIVNDYNVLMVQQPWYKGRVVLIGDAAHATSANLSYGGGMAIEDGVVLGEEFARGGDLDDVLQRFMKRRFERTRLVVDTAIAVQKLQEGGASGAEQNALRAVAMAELNNPY